MDIVGIPLPVYIIKTNLPSEIKVNNSIVCDICGGTLNGRVLPDIPNFLVRLKETVIKNKIFVLRDLEKIEIGILKNTLLQIEKRFLMLNNKLIIVSTRQLNLPFVTIQYNYPVTKKLKENNIPLEYEYLFTGLNEDEINYLIKLIKHFNPKNREDFLLIKQKYIKAPNFFIKKTPIITLDEVGGHLQKIEYFKMLKNIYTKDLNYFETIKPKCFLFVGTPGTGKTMLAEAVANNMEMPFYIANISAIFSKYVGETEANATLFFEEILNLHDSVILIDEIDKMLSGYFSYGETDAGVMARVLGTFLTNLQDRKFSSIIIATSNEVKALPPALIRKGRWDEIFYFDKPSEKEKIDIIQKICEKNKIKSSTTTEIIKLLVKLPLTGADINHLIKKSILFHLSNKKGIIQNIQLILEEEQYELSK